MLRKNKQTPQEQSDQEFNLALEVPAEQRPKGWRPFVRRNWKRIAAAACAAAVAGAFLLPGKGAKPAGVDTAYLESAVERRNITNVFSGSGTIAAANTYTVNALVSGTVLTADFAVGDTIEEGTVLYTIDSSNAANSAEKAQLSLDQAQRNYEDAVDAQYVRSTISGTLASYKVAVGDVVTAGQEVATVRDASTLLLTLEFPAADAANFTVGQAAQVTLDGTFEAISGTVRSVSGADALSSGNLLVRTVTIAVNNTGSLTTAQAATASVNGVSALASAKFSYQNEQTITASTGGTVTALCVKEGSSVSADTALVRISGKELTKQVQNASDNLRSAQMSMEDTEDQLNNYTITSPISGTVISKEVKAGDTVSNTAGSTSLCTIYDLSYLEMTIKVDELQVSSLKVGQSVQVTADAVKDKTYEGLVTRVSMKGDTSGGTTTYPVTVRIDETTGLRPGMNANAEIVVAQAKNALTVPNAAIVRGSYVLVRQDSPSAVNADASMSAPEGYVYVKVKTGVSDDNYTQVTSGLSESDTIAYDPSSVSSDSYYDDGGYDYSDGEVIGGTENAADPAEGGEEMLPEETENAEEPAADAEEPAEGIDPAETGAVVVN